MDGASRKKAISIIEKYLAMGYESAFIAQSLNKLGFKTRGTTLWTVRSVEDFIRYWDVKPLDLTPRNEQLPLTQYPSTELKLPEGVTIDLPKIADQGPYFIRTSNTTGPKDGRICRELELVSAVLNSNIYDPLKKEIIGRITS